MTEDDARSQDPDSADSDRQPAAAEPTKIEAAPPPGDVSREARWLLLGIAALLGLFLVLGGKRKTDTSLIPSRARVDRIEGGPSFLACAPSGNPCQSVGPGNTVPLGSRLKTDSITSAELLLADRARIRIEASTELSWFSGEDAELELKRGALAFALPIAKAPLRVVVPNGRLSATKAKATIRVGRGITTVEVVSGTVEAEDSDDHHERAGAGEVLTLTAKGIRVTQAPMLKTALGFSEDSSEEPESTARGLGELRAKKPGSREEVAGKVRLVSHSIRVKIAGALARTEIEESFENTSNETLEGIYRFPIPPDAQIERLALDVDGKWVDGAFVDRDRAAAIWRGAIVNAAPQARPLLGEDIVWVPGPWRDPALLEWQRGGRFELRIFPIPRHAQRRVLLAYTELVPASGDTRRYSYPLARATGDRNRLDRFEIQVAVHGHDAAVGVSGSGYDFATRTAAEGAELTHHETDALPSGGFSVEYGLPEANAELRAWAYLPERADSGADSHAAYLAILLRPKLPRLAPSGGRKLAIVVDSSRSMIGENYTRAKRLAARLVGELDQTDRVRLLACDSDCQQSEEEIVPGADGERAARRFLDGIGPDGASDPSRALRLAYEALHDSGTGNARIVYIGDGAPTVGPIRSSHLEAEVSHWISNSEVRLTTVAIGPDADTQSLAALARGGGGVMVKYTPGESVAQAALSVLATTAGGALRDVEVSLPEGAYAVAPTRLDSIPAGAEQLIVARMNADRISGTVSLRGRYGSEAFERRYPLRISATKSAAGAFVPRLYAAQRIADLERDGSAAARREAVELSTRFSVASRYSSLLVLESEAMFRAFGLKQADNATTWTGEQAMAEGTAETSAERDDEELETGASAPESSSKDQAPAERARDQLSDEGINAGSIGRRQPPMAPRAAGKASSPAADAFPGAAAPSPAPSPIAPRSEVLEPKKSEAPLMPPPPPPRRMIPMRRIWERSAEISTTRLVPRAAGFDRISELERQTLNTPDRREPVRQLYTLLLLAGETRRAERLVETWVSRDPLDVDALTARADLAARRGDRRLAIRLLGSVIDARPGDIAAQRRLERLQRWAGQPALGCRHLVAAAELTHSDAQLLADAIRCSRASVDPLAERELSEAAQETTRTAADALLARTPSDDSKLSGDVRVEASWSGGQDLDLALIDPDGRRVSWLGAPTRAVISATDVKSEVREGLALRGAKPGDYVLEITRAQLGGPTIQGEILVTIAQRTRRIPFTLTGTSSTVALLTLRLTPRLVPLTSGTFGVRTPLLPSF